MNLKNLRLNSSIQLSKSWTRRDILQYFSRRFIHKRTDQHKSCSALHGEPRLCPCLKTTCNFFGYFSETRNAVSSSSNENLSSKSLEHPAFRLRGRDVTTSPSLPYQLDCFIYKSQPDYFILTQTNRRMRRQKSKNK